ncbi:MAG TPA: histidine kinase famiy protein [Telluria sp.]|nr:histidine kinase famiy protein [Telluria sp.]
MAVGTDKIERLDKDLETQGGGQSVGVPADGELEGNAYNPLGNPGMHHWQASYIDAGGLNERGNIFFAAVEMTRMPMVVTDPNRPDDPIVFANNAFFDLTGYRHDDVVGRNCRLLQGPDTDPRTVAEVRNALAEQRAVAVDILNYKADGTPFWNALFIGPIFDKEGKLLYYFSSQMDITERRTSQESYLQAQKMEAIGQLTAGMAHDFNNLLQVINGNLELTLRALDDAQHPAAEPIQRAQRAALKAAKLTEQLLTFARKQRLEPKRVNLNTLVVEFSEMLVRTLGEKVELRLDLKPGLPSCMLDPTHLEMALLNVLINARDAMPAGGEVTVATSVVRNPERVASLQLPAGPYVAICVTDTGEGMSPEVLRRATEPFFTTKGPGTGLGLAMVHGFVQQSHGRLQLESQPGQGTKVHMLFPATEHQPRADGAAPQEAGGRSARQRILVVEDNDDVRELAESVLGLAGYEVISANSGEQALGLLEQQDHVDLLFTDVIMPGGMNGLQLVERVRDKWPELPVLLTTGYMSELSHQGQPELDILAKPYKHSDLLERVRAALHRKAGAAPPGR